MKKTIAHAAHTEAAQRLLAQAGALSVIPEERVAAAGRLYGKLSKRLGPVVGEAGFQSIFARSVKLAAVELSPLARTAFVAAAGTTNSPPETLELQFVRCLSQMDSGAASEIAIHAYATVFALLEKFIGERLVERVLHSAFLETDGTLPKEKE